MPEGDQLHQGSSRRESKPSIDERKPVTIIKAEGTYTILYGRHDREQDSSQLPDIINGVVFETGLLDYYTGNPKIGDQSSITNYLRRGLQYREIFTRLEESKIPAIYADPGFTVIDSSIEQLPSLLAGTAIGGGIIEQVKYLKSTIHRRDFLKLGARVALATAVIASVGGVLKWAIRDSRDENDPLRILTIVTLRDTIIAHKEQWLMEQMGTNPHLVTIMGEAHKIEDRIQQSSQDRLEFLKTLRPFLTLNAPNRLYKIVRNDFDGNDWKIGEVFDVPDLKEWVFPQNFVK